MKSQINRFVAGLALAVVGLFSLATPVQAGALTDYAENKIIDAVIRAQTLGAPATWYIGLDTVACGETGSGTEVTGGSYARVAVSASMANFAGTQAAASTTASTGASGTTSNNIVVTYATPTASWGTVVSMRWWDLSTGGNAWICAPLGVSKTINIGDNVTFPAAALTFQLDN
ncbi:MAG: phage tail fiber protein [Hydrogenophaga sp.]|uniref:phage tail fiber protein n=1 Tax=Hydrogenophaga sp. TaxID=1904254 RepID=UPI004037252D